MPELPEVETSRRGIYPHIIDRTVKGVLVRQAQLRWPISPELGQALSGQKIQGLSRRGKYLFVEVPRGRMMIHLGMSGSLRILNQRVLPEKHDHVDILLDNDLLLRYRDPRRFGSIFWLAGEDGHSLIDSLGPEPLEDDFNVDYLFAKSRKRKLSIKLFLMNSQIVVGVGNIYANEALFAAAIRPNRPAGKVTKKQYGQLVAAVKRILEEAISAGGTTLKDFVKEDGSPGYFKQALNVYGRGGQPCHVCDRPLKEIRMAQRTTVFCTHCQI